MKIFSCFMTVAPGGLVNPMKNQMKTRTVSKEKKQLTGYWQ